MELLQSQLNLELANAEREAQLKVEEEERKSVGQSQKFLVSTCKLFNSYVFGQVKISQECIGRKWMITTEKKVICWTCQAEEYQRFL
jgi:hypothetical protein